MTDKEWAEIEACFDRGAAVARKAHKNNWMSGFVVKLLCNPLPYVIIISLLIIR